MKNKSSFYFSWFIALAFCVTAFFLLSIGWTGYGISIFGALPIALGISTGLIPDRKWAAYGLLAALGFFFLGLLVMGLEGMVCLLMALPIIVPFVFAGYLISCLIKRKRKKRNNLVTLMPFLLFLGTSVVERTMGDDRIEQEVSTSVMLPFDKNQVYDAIIDVDTVSAPASLLHQIGLPIPLGCELTEEKIGGLRICTFEEGEIIETITDFKRGEYLEMDVTEFKLPGRKWLRFNRDLYSMEQIGDSTKITRTTTYFSTLKPRAYWGAIEALTIEKEQDLVFRNLKIDLQSEHSN